jgi:transposase
MLHLSALCRYYLYQQHTDMRKGFDSLCGIVQHQLGKNALSGDVFIFLNKRRTHIKLLLWEGDGFSVYYKRLEKGTYELPESKTSAQQICITCNQLMLMLQGISLRQVHYRVRYQHQPDVC